MLGPILIGISAAAAVLLLVLLILVFRHLARLARAVELLTREVLPAAERLRREAEEVQDRLDRLDERAVVLREAAQRRDERRGRRSTGLPGARR
jgi:biopolymer transport protein ExbB/TolQ